MKRFLVFVLLVTVLMVLAACGSKSNSATGVAAPEVTSIESADASGNTVDSAVVPPETSEGSADAVEPSAESTVETEPVVEPEPEDPYTVLEVSEDIARSEGGFYLKRGDKFYSLNSTVGKDTVGTYGVGRKVDGVGKALSSLYATALAGEGIVTMGDVPLIVVEEDDQIISLGYTGMALYEFEFYGDSLRIGQADKYYSKAWCIYDNNGAVGDAKRRTNLEVRDENGNLVEDCNNVEKGKAYTVSWFEGTDYYEIEMLSDCYCYKFLDLYPKYSLDGALSKESYAVYDLSEVGSGIWRTSNGGFFQIP